MERKHPKNPERGDFEKEHRRGIHPFQGTLGTEVAAEWTDK
jgi:hypothetical protein